MGESWGSNRARVRHCDAVMFGAEEEDGEKTKVLGETRNGNRR